MSRFFANIHSLRDITDEAKRTELINEIRSNTQKYIIKPQKEGGGNNYYNDDILMILPPETDPNKISDLLNDSIIMERLNPPEVENYILYENKLKKCTCINEMGVYGIIISDDKTIHVNKNAGFLLRTKESDVQEGGVVTGYSAIDIPYLVDMKLEKDDKPLSFN